MATIAQLTHFVGSNQLVVCPVTGAVFFAQETTLGKVSTKVQAKKACSQGKAAKAVKVSIKKPQGRIARLSREVKAAIAALRVASSQVGFTYLGRGVQALRATAVAVLKAAEEVKSSNTQAFKEYHQARMEVKANTLTSMLRACGIFLA